VDKENFQIRLKEVSIKDIVIKRLIKLKAILIHTMHIMAQVIINNQINQRSINIKM
jgi:hypothetical protein